MKVETNWYEFLGWKIKVETKMKHHIKALLNTLAVVGGVVLFALILCYFPYAVPVIFVILFIVGVYMVFLDKAKREK